MKLFSVITAACVALPVFAAPLEEPSISARETSAEGPQGTRILPKIQSSPPKKGSYRKEIKYGPYTINPKGMLNKAERNATKPCTDCYVTGMQATLRYENGTEANTDTGVWLHHIVLGGSRGPIWAAGNERPTLRLDSEHKFGMDWPKDLFSISVDLMSEAPISRTVNLVITYDYVLKSESPDYKASYVQWNSIGSPAAKQGVYSFKSRVWNSTFDGKLLYTIGHMHDGGTDTQLFINDKLVCKSIMYYGANDASTSGSTSSSSASTDPAKTGKEMHISAPGACENFGTIKKGDSMRIEAWYDANKYPLMAHNGDNERLMGNMRVYMGPDEPVPAGAGAFGGFGMRGGGGRGNRGGAQ